MGFKRLSIFTKNQPTIALSILHRPSYAGLWALVDSDYNRKNHDVSYVSITIITAIFLLFAISVSILTESTRDHHTAGVTDVYAQPWRQ